LGAIERLAEEHFNSSLARIDNTEQLQHGVALFRRHVFSLKRTQILTARVELVSDEELPEIRKAVISTISDRSSSYPSTGYLLHSDNSIFRILATDAPPILIECVGGSRAQLTLVNLFCSSLPFSSTELEQIFDLTLREKVVIDDTWRRYIDSPTATPTTSECNER
jgi:hypothetical protein